VSSVSCTLVWIQEEVLFLISSAVNWILGWSDSFPCLSTFYHCVKIPETINLKGGKIYVVCCHGVCHHLASLPLGLCKAQKSIMAGAHGRGSCLPHTQDVKEIQELARSQYLLQGRPA
jgi:hypothetical protein